MFLTLKRLIKPFDDAWFAKTTMGKNTITSMQLSIIDIKDLKNKQITNKIGRGTNITHIEQMFSTCGIQHGKNGSQRCKKLQQVHQTNKKIINQTLQCIVERETFHGNNLTYQKVFDQETNKQQVIEVLIYLIYVKNSQIILLIIEVNFEK